MSTAQIRVVEDYNRLINRTAIVHAIRAAVDLGIIKTLESGQKTIDQLADMLDLQREPLALLMNVLCQTEVVEKYDDDYALSAVARLIPSQVFDLGDRYWQYLSGVVRTGVRLPADDEVPVSDRDFFLDLAASEWTYTPVALDAAEVMEIGSRRTGFRMLELGCGAGMFGAAIAHRDPEIRLVMVDQASALQRTQKTVEGVQLQNRTRLVEADYFDPDIVDILEQDQFDMVLLAGILNRHSPEQTHDLLQRLKQLVKPGGELAIIDMFPGQEKGDKHRTIFELELFVRTSFGTLPDPKRIQDELQKLGYEQIQYAHLPSVPHTWGLILAEKP